jgi:ribosomal protein L40E
MIVCPNCQQHNPEDAGHCSACGGSLEGFAYRVCPACGALSPARNTFCHRCLAALVPEAAQPGDSVDETIAPFVPSAFQPLDEPMPQPGARRIRMRDTAPAEQAEQEPPAPDANESAPATAQPPAYAHAEMRPQAPAPSAPAEEATIAEEARAALADMDVPLPESLTSDLAHPQELLPLEPIVSLPHRAQTPRFARPSEAEQFDAELFYRIATEPASLAESSRVVLPRQSRLMPALGRALLYLLVLLAALTPFITGSDTLGPQLAVATDAQAARMADAIAALPANAHVLLAVDYEASYAGELDPLAGAVLHQLAQHDANLLVMSTKPTGMGLAQSLFRDLAADQTAYQTYGERYVLAGYLPGNEAALRTLSGAIDVAFKQDYVLGQPLSQLSATQQLATLTELDAVIVISDDGQVVRRWIEQVLSRTQVPMYALVTARIKPLLLPYAQAGQLSALLGGAADASEYGIASEGPQWALPNSQAYLAYLAVLVLAAIATNVAYLARKRVKCS